MTRAKKIQTTEKAYQDAVAKAFPIFQEEMAEAGTLKGKEKRQKKFAAWLKYKNSYQAQFTAWEKAVLG